MTKILMLLENFSYPGDGRVRKEAKALTKSGFKVSVIAPASHGQPWREIVDRVRVYRYPGPPRATSFISYLWEYGYSMVMIFMISFLVLLIEGFDIIHAHHPPDFFALIGCFYKLLGKSYVLDHHDLAPELYFSRFSEKGNVLIHRVLLWFEHLGMRIADHVISTNLSYKQIAIQRGHVQNHRITIVRNGPDLDEFRSFGAEYIFQKDGKKVLGYVGETGIQDGVDNLLMAIHHVVHTFERQDVKCIILGDGVALPQLKLLSKQLGITPYVVFMGYVYGREEVVRYLSTMDICIAPEPSNQYNDKSTAIKVMEYMAMGKPVVSFDLPEHRFTAREAAIYAVPNDTLDLAKKIVELMDNPGLRSKLGRTGRNRIESELAWHHQVKNLLEVYQGLL